MLVSVLGLGVATSRGEHRNIMKRPARSLLEEDILWSPYNVLGSSSSSANDLFRERPNIIRLILMNIPEGLRIADAVGVTIDVKLMNLCGERVASILGGAYAGPQRLVGPPSLKNAPDA